MANLRAISSYERRPRVVTTTNQGPWTRLVSQAMDFLLPRACLSCQERSSCSALGLCHRCRPGIGRRGDGSGCCRTCGVYVPALDGHLQGRCGECLSRPKAIERLFFLYDYQPPIDAVIHGLKYRRLEYLARPLAAELFDRFAESLEPLDVVVPIPLHRWRALRRGFNQAEAIAVPLARRLGKPRQVWLRHRRGRPQSLLSHDQRAANARRLLGLKRSAVLSGERVLLVDDVTTTGATLEAAARLLLRAGASSVAAAVVARTPEPGADP